MKGRRGNQIPNARARWKLGAASLPCFMKDITDRNRTSPFAFTGNKFEFRMVGSSASIAGPIFIINSAVADVLSEVADRLEAVDDKILEMKKITAEFIRNHKRIVFNGDNYSEEWRKEAERRGLPNITNFVDAKKTLLLEKNIKMFVRQSVLSEKESHSRYEILMENYNKTIRIEALTAVEMVKRDILPVVLKYIGDLATAMNQIPATGVHLILDTQEELLTELSSHAASAHRKVKELEKEIAATAAIQDVTAQGVATVQGYSAMKSLREDIDAAGNAGGLPNIADATSVTVVWNAVKSIFSKSPKPLGSGFGLLLIFTTSSESKLRGFIKYTQLVKTSILSICETSSMHLLSTNI